VFGQPLTVLVTLSMLKYQRGLAPKSPGQCGLPSRERREHPIMVPGKSVQIPKKINLENIPRE